MVSRVVPLVTGGAFLMTALRRLSIRPQLLEFMMANVDGT